MEEAYMKLKLNCVRCVFNTSDLTTMKNHANDHNDDDEVINLDIKFEQDDEELDVKPCSVQKCQFVARSNGEVSRGWAFGKE